MSQDMGPLRVSFTLLQPLLYVEVIKTSNMSNCASLQEMTEIYRTHN